MNTSFQPGRLWLDTAGKPIRADGFCTQASFLVGGIVGVETLVSAFGFGPVIALFSKDFTPMLRGKQRAK